MDWISHPITIFILAVAGIATTLIMGLRYTTKKKKKSSQYQKVGDRSKAIQAGRDVNINSEDG